ncbi:caspase family protein [Streptomyces roseolilacinus]|uniref:caspase family protein n=1 Tax=Streptomyces roseolilacinus TaxID=66904 RepID=UPI0038044125
MTTTTAPAGAARRALVIASETYGLRGCRNDAELIGASLRAHGFDVHPVDGPDATRAGILGAYEDLIRATRPGDAALVYYAGHGSRLDEGPGHPPGAPGELRFLLPTDIARSTADDFRGILGDELSVLQWRLTLRTRNVTTLLDSCHSARMSRDPLPEGTNVRGRQARWPRDAVRRRWAEAAGLFRRLRAEHPDEPWYDDNPHAVRMVACSPGQRAFEAYSPEFGAVHGLFTAAVVAALDAGLTWHMLGERVRHRVLTHHADQRPEAEGPTSRVLFGEARRERPTALPVRLHPGTASAWLDGAALHGIEVGDAYLLGPLGGTPDPATAPVAVVVEVRDGAARLVRRDRRAVPDGAEARPVGTGRPARPVRLRVDGGGEGLPAGWPDRWRAAVPGLRTDAAPAAGDLATIVVRPDGVMLFDAAGRALYERPRPLDGEVAARVGRDVEDLAVAARLRELGPGSVPYRLSAPVAFDAVVAATGAPVRDAVLHPGDRVRMRVRNLGAAGAGTVYANVLDLGVGGRVSVLNTAEPSGVELVPGESRSLGRWPGGEDPGLPVSWPAGLPRDGPRFETLTAVFSDRPQNLGVLVREGAGGRRDVVAAPSRDATRMAVLRVTFLLCPGGPGCAHA